MIFSALILTTCKKMPELKVYELELTSENVAYSQTSAEIKVEYDYPTDLQYVNVTMSESNYFGYSIVAQSNILDSVFIANFVDLHTDKKYYYKFEYSNGVNVVTSDVRSFYLDPTLVSLPTVITKDVTNITGTSAKCGGTITDDGGYYVTSRGVCWSTHRNPTIFDNYTTDGMNTGTYTSTMTNLEENTVYYVRAFAINEKGSSYGTEYSFETSGSGGGGGGSANLPTVTTASISNITANSATSGGNVTSNGGSTVTARGVCWSTSQNPTINNSYTTTGSGTGAFTSAITGLTANTTYYVRAYATNGSGTAYGSQKTFTTSSGGSGTVPTGAINGAFSVSATKKVYFSQGNLQYRASTNTWRFAEHQYDMVGDNNYYISPTYNGWIDLFGWGTGDRPTYDQENNGNYYYFSDWGNNAITNGGNSTNIWRTMTSSEWDYILNTRTTNSGIRYAKAVVNGIKGLILLPDNWSASTYSLNNTNTSSSDYTNTITLANWNNKLEAAGAVFLPAGGSRSPYYMIDVGAGGYYWTSTPYDDETAHEIQFHGYYLHNQGYARSQGCGVRLVCDE